MCKTFSFIGYKNGDVFYSPVTDCHEDLIAAKGLKDNGPPMRNWIRGEYAPKNNEYHKIKTYQLTVDEECPPFEVTDSIKESWESKMYDLVKSMILHNVNRKILLGGTWILSGETKIDKVINVRIISMNDSSNIGYMLGSSNISFMNDSSNIGSMYDSSNISFMNDSSNIGSMYDSSNIGYMYNSSNIGYMRGSSNIKNDYRTKK